MSVENEEAPEAVEMAPERPKSGPTGRQIAAIVVAVVLAAGFVVGRLRKGVMKASDLTGTAGTKPSSDAFVSNVPTLSPEPSYPTAGYPTSTVEPGYAETPYGGAGYTVPTSGSTEYASTGTGTPLAVPDDDLQAPLSEQGRGSEGRL